jgi:hypothetical protein
MAAQMATLGNKITKEEIRGDMVTGKNDALEKTQTTLAGALVSLVDGINEFKYNVKKETSALKEGINEVKYDARKDASELKDMMRQLMNNNSNNRTRHTPVTSTEKRKHDAKTPSTNPEEREMPSPDHRKQRQHSQLKIMDPPTTTVPLAVDF